MGLDAAACSFLFTFLVRNAQYGLFDHPQILALSIGLWPQAAEVAQGFPLRCFVFMQHASNVVISSCAILESVLPTVQTLSA
jgi:hypothetical protein